ncbi:MAG: S9 family peptidase [Chlorobi bacterium]|nr:S9 family peptidase [Chlorobiota bacterium]
MRAVVLTLFTVAFLFAPLYGQDTIPRQLLYELLKKGVPRTEGEQIQGTALWTDAVKAFSGKKRPLTIRDYLGLEYPRSLAASPDGKYVAFTIRRPTADFQGWQTQVHVLRVLDKNAWQVTTSAASCWSPAWSPDGNILTFLSTRERPRGGESTQLFALPFSDGGEAHAMTALENGVEEYAWSPTGSVIVLLTEESMSKEESRRGLKTTARSSRDPKPGKVLYLLDPRTGAASFLAAVDRGVTNLRFSPDGNLIVFQSNHTGEYNDEQKFGLFVMSLDGTLRQLTDAPGPETSPRFSPDGKKVAFITQTVPDIEFAETDLSIIDVDGSGMKNLTGDFDFSVKDFAWTKSGLLLAQVDEGMYTRVYSLDPGSGKMNRMAGDNVVLSDLSVASESGAVFCGVQDRTSLKEIAVLDRSKLTPLTAFSHQLERFRLGDQRVISFRSTDDKFDIEALVLTPPGFSSGKKYPLVLLVHGGPYGHYRDVFMQRYMAPVLAGAGFVCLLPNVRGSSGYTDVFSQSNRYDLGGGDYRDAMAAIDYVAAQGFIDTTRMGVMGGSYGGYLTNWIIPRRTGSRPPCPCTASSVGSRTGATRSSRRSSRCISGTITGSVPLT